MAHAVVDPTLAVTYVFHPLSTATLGLLPTLPTVVWKHAPVAADVVLEEGTVTAQQNGVASHSAAHCAYVRPLATICTAPL